MTRITNFSQSDFDDLKVFLISKFNIQFLHKNHPGIKESFEISTKEGNIVGNFFADDSLELISDKNTKKHFDIIMEFISNLKKQILPQNKSSSDGSQISNVKSVLSHIVDCTECQKKLDDILSHSKK